MNGHIVSIHRKTNNSSYGPKLSAIDLARYIQLAKLVNPKITKPAHECMIRCYKKLREDRHSDRGSAGITVRQLESLVRLSEAIARVHLDPEVKVEYVAEAFRLQMDTLMHAEKENIDLSPEIAESDVVAPIGEDASTSKPVGP